MQKVLTAEQMRTVDRLTIERYGIPSILLMENAAHAVARVITEKLGGSVKGKSVLILSGKGNNGGDGFAVARVLWNAGAAITVCLLFPDDEIVGDAKQNLSILRGIHSAQTFEAEPAICLAEVGTHRSFFDRPDPFFGPDVVVDAVFGTGLVRPLGEELSILARQYNSDLASEKRPIFLSIDIPSGLSSDDPEPIGEHFSADVTVGFTAAKLANILPPASRSNGELIIENIGSSQVLIDEQPSQLFLAESDDASMWLAKTAFSSGDYKNKRGHALVIAGSDDYSGAAVMCGNSAMRSGGGLTTLLVPASCKVEIASRVIPEVIVKTLAETDGEVSGDAYAANAETIRQADSILIGPGLKANDKGIEKLIREIVQNRTVPVVIDAGALSAGVRTLLSASPVSPARKDRLPDPDPGLSVAEPGLDAESASMRTGVSAHHPLILTPHEGEFLRLLGTEDKSVIKDRVAAVREYATSNGVILVLKGERVLIGAPDGRVVVNPTGNSGLGKAGNGDTLAGILAGFIAQAAKMDIDIFETVVAAVYVAGMAGDVAAKKYGKRVMTASDVRECLTEVFEALEKK